MRQKKKAISSVKKKPIKRAKAVRSPKILSKKVLIGIVILFISLFIIVAFSSQQQIFRGNAAITSSIFPTFGSIGDCKANNNCPTGAVPPSMQEISVDPHISVAPSSSLSPSSNPAPNPCTSSNSIMSKSRRSAGQGGFLQIILQFLQLLLQLFQQLLGGGMPSTPGTPQQGPSVQPNPSVSPSGAPVPSQAPCPPTSNAPQPSGQQTQPTSAPTSGTVPTNGPVPTSGTTASCVTSAPQGRCPSSGYYTDSQIVGGTNPWVNQNIWGAGGTNYQQTLHANGAGDWYITASVSNNSSGAVLTFPNTGWSMPTKTIASYSTITSSWNVTIPTDNKTSAGWAAYDLWFNNWADEVMIQTDIVANSNYNCTSAASTTINGQPWHLCDFGSERVVKPGTDDNNLRNETSGSVDVKAVLQWLEQTGHLPKSSVWTAGSFGFEVTNTSGTTQTFKVNGFTWTSQ